MAKSVKHPYHEDFLTKIIKKLEHFFSGYLKIIITTISAIVILTAAYFTVDYVLSKREDRANVAFGKVYLRYMEIVDKQDIEEDELNEKLISLNEDFKLILEEHPRSKSALKSAYFIGNNLYRIRNYKEALQYFKKGYTGNSKSYLAILCFLGEASSYEQLEEYKKAEQIYKKIIETYSDDFIIPHIKFNLGQIYEKQDKLEKAEEEYSQIVSKYQWSSWKELAEKRLLLIKNFK